MQVLKYYNMLSYHYTNVTYLLIYSVILLLTILLVLSLSIRSIILMRIVIVVLVLLSLLLTLLYCCEWILVVLIGDICSSTSSSNTSSSSIDIINNNIIGSLRTGTIRTLLTYYTTCTTTTSATSSSSSISNPYVNPYNIAMSSYDSINSILTTIQDSNPSSSSSSCNINTSMAKAYLAEVLNELTSINSIINCNNINSIWSSIINSSICSNTIDGIFIIWVFHIILAWSLVVVSILSLFLLKYYDNSYWLLSKDTIVCYDDDDGGINDNNVYEIGLVILGNKKHDQKDMQHYDDI